MKAMILWDPKHEYQPGEVVESSLVAMLNSKHVASIPYEPGLSDRNALGGCYFRQYGKGLVPPPAMFGKIAPLLLFIASAGGEKVALRMRLQADGQEKSGTIRLIHDSAQTGVAVVGLSGDAMVSVDQLGPPDAHGGWTVSAEARLGAKVDSYQGLALYGATKGVRVLWAAVAQVR